MAGSILTGGGEFFSGGVRAGWFRVCATIRSLFLRRLP